MDSIKVTYRIHAAAEDAVAGAEAVLLEQTVETPLAVARRDAFVREHMMGRVLSLEPDGDGTYLAVLSLPTQTASVDAAQFLNVLFGNSSLHAHVFLEDFEIPLSMQALFSGPRYGVWGLRERTGIWDRPLTCSALKPVGLPLETLAALCRTFAEGRLDLIKDDHYLADHPFCRFEERVTACQAAVDEVAARTGHRARYVPNLSGTPDQVRRQADFAQEQGVGAVMVAPMLLGMPFFYELIRHRLDVPVLVHPSFGGALRIRPDVLLGKIFRLYGADAVIFPNYGGRFSYDKATCARLAEALRRDWLAFRPALPVPAGGMDVARVGELVSFFGVDTILLIGGSLLSAGDALLPRALAFTERVAEAAQTITS